MANSHARGSAFKHRLFQPKSDNWNNFRHFYELNHGIVRPKPPAGGGHSPEMRCSTARRTSTRCADIVASA
jgi:hypothetical protein